MNDDRLAVPVSAATLAKLVNRHEDYRVQTRLQTMERRLTGLVPSAGLVGIALDVETTGLDQSVNEVVELAVQRFRVDVHGRIVETGRPRTWLEEPSTPIPAEVTRITGLTDAVVAGRSISDGEATALILDADFVVAHNAAFDRPFVERRLPLAAGRPWVCSLADLDWKALGFESLRLSDLLCGMGWFYDAHRAEGDVTALLHLLDHRLKDGTSVVSRIVDRASRPSWIVDAEGAPFSAKDVLKERGYRWNDKRRLWCASIAEDAIREEIDWATVMLYGGRREPEYRRVTWRERYA